MDGREILGDSDPDFEWYGPYKNMFIYRESRRAHFYRCDNDGQWVYDSTSVHPEDLTDLPKPRGE